MFIRGAGGWGGERGPSARSAPPERAPDDTVAYTTRPDQALLYRLNGDRNPLHSDPSFAARGGFDTPILHGLCTYGFTGRALLHTLCGSDPARFVSMSGRFSQPVLPGQTLTVSIWRTGPGRAAFLTASDTGTVIDGGELAYVAD
jgi:acyl dehydratase